MNKKSNKKSSVNLAAAIELSDSWGKLLTLEKIKENLAIKDCQLFEYSRDDISGLKERLASLKAPKDLYETILVIPRSEVFFREIRIPTSDLAEIPQAVHLYVENLSQDLNKEGVVYRYLSWTIQETESAVFLYLLRSQWIRERILLLNSIGFKVRHVYLSSEILSNALLGWMNQAKVQGVIGVIDVDYRCTEVVVVDGTRMIFSRSFPFGAGDLIEKKVTLYQYLQDINLTLLAYQLMTYQKTNAKPAIAQLLVTGMAVKLENLTENLVEDLRKHFVKPFEEMSQADFFVGQNIVMEGRKIAQARMSLVALIGSVSNADRPKNDFFPEEVRLEEQRKKNKKELTLSLALLAILIVICGTIAAIGVHRNRYLAKRLEEAVKTISPIARNLEARRESLKRIEAVLAKRGEVLNQLKVLYETAGKDIYLTTLEYSIDPPQMEIRGTAKALPDVLNYLSQLKKTEIFGRAELKNSQRKKAKQGEITYFEISLMTSSSR